MPEFWTYPVCSIRVESWLGPGEGSAFPLDPTVRTGLLIQRAIGNIQTWGRRMPDMNSPVPAPSILRFGEGPEVVKLIGDSTSST